MFILLGILIIVALFLILRIQQNSHAKNSDTVTGVSFFTEEEYQLFTKMVLDYQKSLGKKATITPEGTLQIEGSDGEYGLLNLEQTCRGVDKKEWPMLIARHFEAANATQAEHEKIQSKIGNFKEISKYLTVRVYPESYVDSVGKENNIYREDLPGLYSVLTIDLPSSVVNVQPKDFQKWKKSQAEVFTIALKNTKKLAASNQEKYNLGDNLYFIGFSGESVYVGSLALMLSQYPDCVGKYGALVSVPTRSTLMCYPIISKEVIRAHSKFTSIAYAIANEGPGTISSNVYWYRDGSYLQIPYDFKNGSLTIRPPEKFTKLLNDLAQ